MYVIVCRDNITLATAKFNPRQQSLYETYECVYLSFLFCKLQNYQTNELESEIA